jgi:hypothetical protein
LIRAHLFKRTGIAGLICASSKHVAKAAWILTRSGLRAAEDVHHANDAK